MQLFSSSPNSIFPPSLNPNSSKTHFRIQTKILQTTPPLLKIPPFSSSKDSSAPALEEKLSNNEFRSEEVVETEGMLMVRRPVKEFIREADGGSLSGSDGGEDMEGNKNSKSVIDESLSELAKKMPIFEPKRVETSPKEKPIPINLELGLYRAKVLTKNFQYNEAIDMLGKCVLYWPEDGRAYVALGKIFSKQSRYVEARAVYERGCQATQGENSYIWQCWAVLENKMGNLQRARELFDAATVANNKHIAAWHGWAILELKQGNVKKGRNLLAKGIKYSGGNEYIYQTLALLEAKGKRIEEARYLFKQATNCNPKSCASWLAWAQVEMQQENNFAARKLFEQAVQASPKNRFAWHVWGIFEANLGDINKGRKLLKIGHALNPRDPVLLQSLALLEYKYSTANLARVLFRRASELDPKHQPVWVAWGWMEWREGNLDAARQLYRTALSINPRSESAARCLQAWGVLEQRIGDYTTARRFFRASLDVNSQSFVTWMTWALMEEEIGDSIRAEEIRELYFLQRTEVVDDYSWGMGFQDMIDPALNSIKKFLNIEQESYFKGWDALRDKTWTTYNNELEKVKTSDSSSDFDVDAFVKETLNLDTSKLDILMETPQIFETKVAYKSVWRAKKRTPAAKAQSLTDST